MVFPELSFHTKNFLISNGEAEERVLGTGRDERKLTNSLWREDFFFLIIGCFIPLHNKDLQIFTKISF